MKYWFTADTHLGHAKILEFCPRPFPNIETMDKELIDIWNSVVSSEDTVYHLGDFAWRSIGDYVRFLNGNIHLIRGSQDKQIGNFSRLFTTVSDLKRIVIEGNVIILCHYPMRTWQDSHFNSWQLHGHHHGRLWPLGKQFDVGIDSSATFAPFSYEEIAEIMGRRRDNPNFLGRKEGNGQ